MTVVIVRPVNGKRATGGGCARCTPLDTFYYHIDKSRPEGVGGSGARVNVTLDKLRAAGPSRAVFALPVPRGACRGRAGALSRDRFLRKRGGPACHVRNICRLGAGTLVTFFLVGKRVAPRGKKCHIILLYGDAVRRSLRNLSWRRSPQRERGPVVWPRPEPRASRWEGGREGDT